MIEKLFEEKSLHKFSKTCFSPLKISHMCNASVVVGFDLKEKMF